MTLTFQKVNKTLGSVYLRNIQISNTFFFRMSDPISIALARAFVESVKPGDITTCDDCDSYVLTSHTHVHVGLDGQSHVRCPDCDLPEKWHCKFSRNRGIRYYVYLDPLTNKSFVQWGHPTKDNPLHVKGDTGCPTRYKTRKPQTIN